MPQGLALPPALPPTHRAYLDAVVASQIVLVDRLEPTCDGNVCMADGVSGREERRGGRQRKSWADLQASPTPPSIAANASTGREGGVGEWRTDIVMSVANQMNVQLRVVAV